MANVMPFRLFFLMAVAVLVLGSARPAVSGGPMQACTAQWQAQGLSRADYRPFLIRCLKDETVAPAPVKVAVKPKPVKAKSTRHGTTAQAGRMKACGAQWRQMKAAGTTEGQTWRQFASQCLRNK